MLETAGAGAPVRPAGFRAPALSRRYRSRGDECFHEMAEWLRTRGAVPRSDLVAEELAALRYVHDVDGRIALEDRAQLAERLGRSPAIAEAMAATFSWPER
jgi:hypothetical protein